MVLGLSLRLVFICIKFSFMLRESEFLIEDSNNCLIIDNWWGWALPPPEIGSQNYLNKAKIEYC